MGPPRVTYDAQTDEGRQQRMDTVGVARSIMAALARQERRIVVPDNDWADLVETMADVPQKPEGYWPHPVVEYEPWMTVLVSGGLDSTAAYYKTEDVLNDRTTEGAERRQPQAIYVNAGQPYLAAELGALSRLGISRLVLDEDKELTEGAWEHINPGRNLLYLALAAREMKWGGSITMGAVQGEIPSHGGDKSWAFFQKAEILLDQGSPHEVTISLPVSQMTKGQCAEYLVERLGLARALETYSCFTGRFPQCGRCQACLRYFLAFVSIGLRSEVRGRFDVDPIRGAGEFVDNYRTMWATKAGQLKYGPERIEEDLRAMSRAEELQNKVWAPWSRGDSTDG